MDKFDEAVEYFKKNPGSIRKSWDNPSDTKHGCLFGFADDKADIAGCLTQIRSIDYMISGFGQEYTDKIKSDERIPLCPEDINEANLYVFAEYQREMEQMRQA